MSKTVIVDIDGTVALRVGDNPRSAYEFHRVGEDAPNSAVITVVQALAQAGHRIVFLSGREDACRTDTLTWLKRHIGLNDFDLYMRRTGDHRRDSIVKREIFESELADHHDILCVLDDRDQVVSMWRNELGLTCLQVDYGDF